VLRERMLADRPAPERQPGNVSAGDCRLPHAWIATEDRLRCLGSSTAAPMLPHHEEFRHVAIERPIRVGHAVEQREPDDPRVRTQQERYVVRFAPVRIERVCREEAAVVDLAGGAVVPLLREVMRVQLHEVLERRALTSIRNYDFDDRHGYNHLALRRR